MAKKVAIVGTGYVGLVTGSCLAEIGHKVLCIDNNTEKINQLKKSIIPIYEPGLKKIVEKNSRRGRLSFSTSIKEGVSQADIIFIAVNTPPREDGSADLSFVETVAREIALSMKSYKIIVEKSTVPVETGSWVETTIKRSITKNVQFDVVSNPEFLREGCAINDFLKPDRIVIGVKTKKAEKIMKELYRPIKAPLIITDIKSAEIIKHASNSFLATKISFINSVANICERVGADVKKVAVGMGLDKRINPSFLNAGVGYGGSCFPKDVSAFYWISKKLGYDFKILQAVKNVNENQKKHFMTVLEETIWNLKEKTVGVLGLSFKPDTDDLRNAPALEIIKKILDLGARIKVYDPVCMDKVKIIFPEIEYCKNIYECAADCDCLLLITEWDEFKKMDIKKIKKIMKTPVLLDGRNIFEPKSMKKLGFIYKGIGR
ncbi:MAG: UDP-glucose/GDP-mannose dehydrogenase family protein [bacterium]